MTKKSKASTRSSKAPATVDYNSREFARKQAEIYKKIVEQEEKDIDIAVENMKSYIKPKQQ